MQVIMSSIFANIDESLKYLLVPNVTTVFPWECDLLSLSKYGLLHEFEIKRSFADFRNNFRKDKHVPMLDCYLGKSAECAIPNYFWFICVDFAIDLLDVPQYAGLIIMNYVPEVKIYQFNERRIAPRLHNEPVSNMQKERLYHSIHARYWKWAQGVKK